MSDQQSSEYSKWLEKLSSLAVKANLPLLMLAVYWLVQMIRTGISGNNYLLLLLGAVVSMAAIFGFIILLLVYKLENKKSYAASILALGGIIPWLFGSYLVLIEGFWSLRALLDNFSFLIVFRAIIYILVGYSLVYYFWKITEAEKLIGKG